MNSIIITIGDELLIGQVENTNASWLANQLYSLGIEVKKYITIHDDKEQILRTLKFAEQNSDIVLITGGLGPTNDDITKLCLCEYFDTKLKFDEKAYENIKKLFAIRNFEITELNRNQAFLPEACKPVYNNCGTASGMWFEKLSENNSKKIFISMPGVPFEMKEMFEQIAIKLQNNVLTGAMFHKTVLTIGMGESFLADFISDWENSLPENMQLAYLPQPGIVRLRLTAKGNKKNDLIADVNHEINKLQKIIPDIIFGYDDDRLEKIIGDLLIKNNFSLSCAESCTGGNISHLITSVQGSSKYFKGSVISYSNEIKIKELNVKKEVLEKYGAVSEQVVRQMALGIREKYNTDFSIATSGIAGPGGATDTKPVGFTWIAVAGHDKVIAEKYFFGEHRGRNIQKTSVVALNMLRKILLKLLSEKK